MSWSSLAIIPAFNGLQLYIDENVPIANDLQVKFVPKLWDNTIFDCSPTASVEVIFDNGQQGLTRIQQAPTASIVTADATGLVINIGGTLIRNLPQVLGTLSGNYVVKASDGANDVVLATGRYQITQAP